MIAPISACTCIITQVYTLVKNFFKGENYAIDTTNNQR